MRDSNPSAEATPAGEATTWRDGLTGRRLLVWAYRAATVAMTMLLLGAAAAFAIFDAAGSRISDAGLAVGFSVAAAYGLFLNRAVGRNWRAYVEGRREGHRWGRFAEVLYPPLWGFSKR